MGAQEAVNEEQPKGSQGEGEVYGHVRVEGWGGDN